MIGSTLLAGVRYLDAQGNETGRRAVFGTVVVCDRSAGIMIAAEEEGTFTPPPALFGVGPAAPGVYRVLSLSEIKKPAYTATFDVHSPPGR